MFDECKICFTGLFCFFCCTCVRYVVTTEIRVDTDWQSWRLVKGIVEYFKKTFSRRSGKSTVFSDYSEAVETVSGLTQSQPEQFVPPRWFHTLSNAIMYPWAHGRQEAQLDPRVSHLDLPGIFLERDCSVEDELQWENPFRSKFAAVQKLLRWYRTVWLHLVCGAVWVHGEVAHPLKLEFVETLCCPDWSIH